MDPSNSKTLLDYALGTRRLEVKVAELTEKDRFTLVECILAKLRPYVQYLSGFRPIIDIRRNWAGENLEGIPFYGPPGFDPQTRFLASEGAIYSRRVTPKSGDESGIQREIATALLLNKNGRLFLFNTEFEWKSGEPRSVRDQTFCSVHVDDIVKNDGRLICHIIPTLVGWFDQSNKAKRQHLEQGEELAAFLHEKWRIIK